MSEKKDATELVELARTIHAWQLSRGKTNSQMIREYPGLGSDKTYGRLREGHSEDYDIEQQVSNYRAVWAVIEATQGGGEAEQLFDDLGPVIQFKRAILETMRAEGNARVLIYQAPSGCGKTAALTIAAGRYGARVLVVECCDIWRDSPSAMLGAILRALGVGELPPGRVERLEKTIDLLKASRRCLVLDEAHHLGPHSLNTLKNLVNQTPGEIVLVAIPTLWAKLESGAYQEARQLTSNRLAERIKFELTESDVVRYLRHIFPEADEAALKTGAKTIRPLALGNGNLAFVRDTARAARLLAGDQQPDAKCFVDAASAAARKR